MRRLLFCGGIGLATAVLSGCGTAWSFRNEPKPEPYGGVRMLASQIEYNTDRSKPRMLPGVTVVGSALDLPFSAIADTVMLPYTLRNAGGAKSVPPIESLPMDGGK